MSEEELRAVWVGAGRPGVDKFYAAVLRSGLAIKRQAAQEFVKKQESRQVFAPGPKSGGRVTASRLDDRWQCDLIDWKQMDASKNDGYKYIFVVVDVFSRFMWTIPTDSKRAKASRRRWVHSIGYCVTAVESPLRWTVTGGLSLAQGSLLS